MRQSAHGSAAGAWGLPAALMMLAVVVMAGCGVSTLDPGPNPARIELTVKATVPEAKLPPGGDVVLWDWGLYLVPEDGPWRRLGPAEGVKFTAKPGNPLEERRTFLSPSGKRKVLLSLEAYHMVTAGDQTVAKTLASYRKEWVLDLKINGTVKITETFGAP